MELLRRKVVSESSTAVLRGGRVAFLRDMLCFDLEDVWAGRGVYIIAWRDGIPPWNPAKLSVHGRARSGVYILLANPNN